MCYWRGRRFELREDEPGPFSGRATRSVVVRGVADLMAMSSAGDFIIYGNDASDATVSFLREHGTHAGPGSDEMQTFILSPPGITLPTPIMHPTQLYEHFIRYSDPPQGT